MNTKVFDLDYKSNMYYKSDRLEMLNFIPLDCTKILDVGCGAANFGKSLKSVRSVEVCGVELNDSIARDAIKNIDKVIVGDIESDNLDIPKGYFDCIVFNDVLEHFKYPWNVLRKSAEYLKDDGYIVASIPNMRYFDVFKSFLIHKEWNYVDEGILDKTHLRFFTEKSAKELFEISGYKIIRFEGIKATTFPWKFRILNTLLMNMFNDVRFLQFGCVARKTKYE